MTRKKLFKHLYIFMVMAFNCLALSSCSSKKPDYLLMFGRDNGFTAAYRAYIRIDGDKVKKTTGWQYDGYILGKNDYGYVRYAIHSFDAYAKGADAYDWEYVQNKYDNEEYDVELVKEMLAQMGVNFTGDAYIIIYDCDDIVIVSAEKTVNNSIEGLWYGIFMNGQMLDIPDNVDMRDLRKVYKLEP